MRTLAALTRTAGATARERDGPNGWAARLVSKRGRGPKGRRPRHISEDHDMSESEDKAKGAANKTVGAAKDKIGEATDNKDLQEEGKAQKLKGHGQNLKGEAKGALDD